MSDYSKLTDKRHFRQGYPEIVIRPKFKIPVYRVALDCDSEIRRPRKKWIESRTPKSFSGSFELSVTYLIQYYIAYLKDTGKFTPEFVLDQIQLVCEFYGLNASLVFKEFEDNIVRPMESRLREVEDDLQQTESMWDQRYLEREKRRLEDPQNSAGTLYAYFLMNYRTYVSDDVVMGQREEMFYDPQKRIPQIADVYRHHETHCMYTGFLSDVAISIGRAKPSFIESLPKYEDAGLIDILTREDVESLQNKDIVPYNHVDDEEFEIWDKSHLSDLEIVYTPLDIPSIVPPFWGGLPIEIFMPPIDESAHLLLERYLNALMSGQ